MLTKDEKEYLKELVRRELEHFRKDGKIASQDATVRFLKAEHDYGHFLEKILEKLK
ncbi:MAG: hypothetical protein QW165_03130 [Candidatus Woesearchaeota archaeon]